MDRIEILEKFGELLDSMGESDEKVSVKEVVFMICSTLDSYYKRVKKDNPALTRVFQSEEMTLTTSLIFNLGLMTSECDDIKSFMLKAEKNEKPN